MQLQIHMQCWTLLLLQLRRGASRQCAGLSIHSGLYLQPKALADCCHDTLPHTGLREGCVFVGRAAAVTAEAAAVAAGLAQ
jgi:hypothetical protein